MRKRLLCVLMTTLLLTGCGAAEVSEAEELALTIRGEYLAMDSCAVQAAITADYGQRVYEYEMAVAVGEEETVLTLSAPETVAGLTARLTGEENLLEFDGVSVETGPLDETGLTPVSAVPALLEALPETEVYIHPKDYPGPDPGLFPLYGQLGGMDCPNIRFFKAFNDRDLPTEEARQLPLGELVIHPIHTPGHSEGSVTLRVSGGPLFCGDSLFAGSCGRTDFPGGNVGKMMSTLRLFGLMDGDAQVFPGHMDFTTLEEERKHNPYLRHALRETP